MGVPVGLLPPAPVVLSGTVRVVRSDTARVVLHGGGDAAGSAPAFSWWALVASVVLVGGVGGLLYRRYGRRDGDAAHGGSTSADSDGRT